MARAILAAKARTALTRNFVLANNRSYFFMDRLAEPLGKNRHFRQRPAQIRITVLFVAFAFAFTV